MNTITIITFIICFYNSGHIFYVNTKTILDLRRILSTRWICIRFFCVYIKNMSIILREVENHKINHCNITCITYIINFNCRSKRKTIER